MSRAFLNVDKIFKKLAINMHFIGEGSRGMRWACTFLIKGYVNFYERVRVFESL